ncbi:MAG: bifunctional 2-polyprenyl-6-hydroxyphenol methylase/3-demethylubiquinol 3-O-methyltransferase UbiG [Burkholderiales bacterium]|nr:bifunctional 2-polyprenyl-6-hydroxyphenol methylase/3-demethylubiquinol 3-O-methyltransferase UbiG [Burkholderiales bacterium]
MGDVSQNADPAELAKFAAVAHRWWDSEGEFRPLHQINPLRLAWIEAQFPLAGKTVLDVGCGGGLLAEAMARAGARVTGIDLAERTLRVAQLHLRESGLAVEYLVRSAEAFAAERPAAFDAVVCMELLEHVPDPARTVGACAALARPGGQVFFGTINRNAKAYLLAVIGAEYVLALLPRGTHDYRRFVRPSELARWCRAAGLRPQRMAGLGYNPLAATFRLTDDCDVNYLLACTKDE